MSLFQRFVASILMTAYLAVSMGNALLHNHDHGHSHGHSHEVADTTPETQSVCHHGHCHHHSAPPNEHEQPDQSPVAPHDHEHDCPACQFECLPGLTSQTIETPTPTGFTQILDSVFEQLCSAESPRLPPSRGPPSIG